MTVRGMMGGGGGPAPPVESTSAFDPDQPLAVTQTHKVEDEKL